MTSMGVFLNAKSQLRAGWRIAVFVMLYRSGSVVFGAVMALLLKVLPESKLIRDGVATALFAANAVVCAFLLLKWVDKRPLASLGLVTGKKNLLQLFEGFGIGLLMLSFVSLGMWILGFEEIRLADGDPKYFFLGLAGNLFLYTAVGFNEEILFRGYLFQAMTEGTGKIIAVVFFSLVFGAAHAVNPNVSPFGIANIVLAGILLSLAYLQTRTLWLPVGIHIGWNFTQGYVWGLPVSGTTQIMPLTISQETGPDFLTGGTFGPEGGAMCTIVCLAACFFVWKFYRPTEEVNNLIRDSQDIEPFKASPSVPVDQTAGT